MGEAVSGDLLSTTLDVSGLERAQWLLKRFPVRLFEALRRANMKSSAVALRVVKGQKLTGQVYNRRTGNLIRSWAVKPPQRVEGGWDGGMGSNAEYARYLHDGFHGDVLVRAHERRVTQVYGRPVSGVVANVSAYTRAVNFRGHPYATEAMTESRPRMGAIHKDEIRVAWEESK
jgi:hypothetical protein